MRLPIFACVIASSLTLFAMQKPAAEVVKVKGVHLCCGECLSIADNALSEVKGVTDISCDLNTKIITFKVDSDKTAASGVKALADAGFFGTATYKTKPLAYPVSGVKKGTKSNSFVISNVHLCCTSCVNAAQISIQAVKGVQLTEFDRAEKTIKLTGDAIDVTEAVTALNKAGFYGKMSQPKINDQAR